MRLSKISLETLLRRLAMFQRNFVDAELAQAFAFAFATIKSPRGKVSGPYQTLAGRASFGRQARVQTSNEGGSPKAM